MLIENYEAQNNPIESPDPIVAVRIRMEEMQLMQKKLIGILGSKGIVSEKDIWGFRTRNAKPRIRLLAF